MNLILLFEADFTSANRVTLTGRRLAHLRLVHKAEVGDTVRVGVVGGAMGTATVLSLNEAFCEMEISCRQAPPPPLLVTLLVALPRPKVLRRLVECVASMGVKKLYIMETWRVEKSYWDSPFCSPTILRDHAILGLEQACDTVVPDIVFRRRFKPFMEDEVPGLIQNTQALAAHPKAEKSFPLGVSGSVTLAVGPEGGFIPFEIELMQKLGFCAVGLGPRILRVEHVVPVLLGRLFPHL